MGFLGALGDQLSSQFSLGENTNHTLNSVNSDGKIIPYGNLGDSAKYIDTSAERKYVEEGYLRTDPYNIEPKQFEILMQEPNATVLVKKRMFSSVAENYRPDYMDKDEKLYYKTIRILLQNKCNQISALEKLSKIEKITSSINKVDNLTAQLIISLTDVISDGFGSGSNLFGLASWSTGTDKSEASSFIQTIDKLRKIYAFNTTNNYTTWITDTSNLVQSTFGQGTGTIEITNFTKFNTNTTIKNSGGSFSLEIADPYECMVITEYDIEKAISDATNVFYNSKLYQFGKETSNNLISDLKVRLNQYRSTRGAGPISFKIDPDTMLGKRVTAIIDRIGTEIPFNFDSSSIESILTGGIAGDVSVSKDYLKDGAIAGVEGLNPNNKKFSNIGAKSNDTASIHIGIDSELSLFQRLIKTIFSQLSLEANSINTFQAANKETNYTRRKLRFNFLGKLLIQPMDLVHFYVNTKSVYDNRLMTGINNMFSGLGFLQELNNTLTDFKNSFNSVFNPSGSVDLQIEKSVYVGSNFPNYLWSTMRNQFVTENEGTHIFAGVVEKAVETYSNGAFHVSVSGLDNTKYFEMGKINFKPSVDVYNGNIFDPLTIHKSTFDTLSSNAKDSMPILLDENQILLSEPPLLKLNRGPSANKLATLNNITGERTVNLNSGQTTQTVYAPDGLVYRWKEGIGIFVQFGSSLSMNTLNSVGAPNIAEEPFAGQDVMNVISLLITGQPYNYMTYMKAATEFDGACKDPQTQQNAAHSYLRTLTNAIAKNNILWGNFIPFKNLTLDEQSYAVMQTTVTQVSQLNDQLDKNFQALRQKRDQAALIGIKNIFNQQVFKDNQQKSTADSLNTDIQSLSTQIDNGIHQLTQLMSSDLYSQSIGNDNSFDGNNFDDYNKKISNSNYSRRLLRKKLNLLTRRMSYNVRANEDKNLFIVDDFYDKDYDITAFNKDLTGGIGLYNNSYTSIKDKLNIASSVLNLEVFCDSQGHIRARTPQYNRMPSSVFYKMMYLKKALNVQIFPQFIEDMFKSQLDTLQERIEILEDQIRLDCAMLGYNNDADAKIFILNYNPDDGLKKISGGFDFISNQQTGLVSDISLIIKSANIDQINQNLAQSTRSLFTNAQRFTIINKALSTYGLTSAGFSINNVDSFNKDTYISTLVNRIQTKSGQRVPTDNYIFTPSNGVTKYNDLKQVDVFKITQELISKVSERSEAARMFYSTIKNTIEYKSLDNDSSTSNKLITPSGYNNSHIPEVFEHMIEDESYDDLGPGSGSRYIIKRSQIINMSISENHPDFTMFQVSGVMNQFASKANPAGLETFPDNGNAMVTAVAIDYDLWRNYGFINSAPVTVPFLSDPNTQCAPYASLCLSRSRKQILSGNLSIAGNEFMQPGEVVFIEDRNLLFYVESVSHNFQYGGRFETSLTLTYGHSPGEYIPTTTDIVGKLLYKNRDVGGTNIQRQTSSQNESNLGILIRSNISNSVIDNGKENTKTNSDILNQNSQTISNILYEANAYILQNNANGSYLNANLELRIYYNNTYTINSDLEAFANLALASFTDQNSVPKQKSYQNTTIAAKALSGNVQVKKINVDTESFSYSGKAVDFARNEINKTSTNGTTSSSTQQAKDKMREILFNYVVDCWINFSSTKTNISQSI